MELPCMPSQCKTLSTMHSRIFVSQSPFVPRQWVAAPCCSLLSLRMASTAPTAEPRRAHGFDYDLFVLGAGSGGVRGARIAASHGAKVAVAEEKDLGGTCVNVGCVPKKLLVYGSHIRHDMEDAAAYGWSVTHSELDWPRLIDNKNKEILRLNGIYERLLLNAGVTVLNGRASLVDAHTIRVGDATVTADKVLIATGSWPQRPPFPGVEHTITSNDVFHLQHLPRRVVIFGAGYIAVEFASIFKGFGALHVDVVFRGDEILRGFDHDVRKFLHSELVKSGISLRPKIVITSVVKGSDGLHVTLSDGTELSADVVLVATGRVPNVAGLHLGQVGVECDAVGAIKVDEWGRTNIPNIFAVGDVTNRINLTPVALHEAHCFADTEFGGRRRSPSHDLVPSAVFTSPPVGTVGMTEEQAVLQFGASNVRVYRSDFKPMKHTMTGRDTRILMKLVVEAASDRVVGVHMVGEEAGEIVQGLAVALKAGATKATFDSTIGIHPTAAEEFVTMRTPSVSTLPSA